MEIKDLKDQLTKEIAIMDRLEQALYSQNGRVNLLKELIDKIENPKKDEENKK